MYFVLEIFNVRYANYHDIYDVTFHNGFLRKFQDLGISCIVIIKPCICVMSTYYTNICYVLSNLNQLRIKVVTFFQKVLMQWIPTSGGGGGSNLNLAITIV